MPPRPRPRARVAALALGPSSSAAPAPASEPSSAQTKETAAQRAARLRAVEDEDALFMRNNRRSKRDWETIEAREQALEEARLRSASPTSTNGHSSDEDAHATPKPRGRRSARKPAASPSRPAWTKEKNLPIILDDSSDDEIIFTGSTLGPASSQSSRTAAGATSPTKRKRSRSRSLTPPPGLSDHQLEHVRNIVRRTLAPANRPPSPTHRNAHVPLVLAAPDPDLTPELASIAKRIHARPLSAGRPPSGTRSRGASAEPSSGAGSDTVQLTVRWTPHPSDAPAPPRGWKLTHARSENLLRVGATIAGLAGVPAEELVLALAGRRVFASATPAALGIWAQGELTASTRATFDALRDARARARSASLEPEPAPAPDVEFAPALAPVAEEEPAGEAKFKLVIRAGASGKDITIAVRPSTTCGMIVRAYAKAAKLSRPPTGACIVVDGERMDADTPIGEADLEEGDMVEIAGL